MKVKLLKTKMFDVTYVFLWVCLLVVESFTFCLLLINGAVLGVIVYFAFVCFLTSLPLWSFIHNRTFVFSFDGKLYEHEFPYPLSQKRFLRFVQSVVDAERGKLEDFNDDSCFVRVGVELELPQKEAS